MLLRFCQHNKWEMVSQVVLICIYEWSWTSFSYVNDILYIVFCELCICFCLFSSRFLNLSFPLLLRSFYRLGKLALYLWELLQTLYQFIFWYLTWFMVFFKSLKKFYSQINQWFLLLHINYKLWFEIFLYILHIQIIKELTCFLLEVFLFRSLTHLFFNPVYGVRYELISILFANDHPKIITFFVIKNSISSQWFEMSPLSCSVFPHRLGPVPGLFHCPSIHLPVP